MTIYVFAKIKEDAGYSCIRLEGKAIRHEVIRMKEKYDDIVIDVGARDSSSTFS